MKYFIKIKNDIICPGFKASKNKLLKVKLITIVIALSGILFTLLFMNCSSSEAPLSDEEIASKTPQTSRTNPNPQGTPVIKPKEGETSNITWLHKDVSSWARTSEITNVEIKTNGEVCIYHSKSGQWEAKSIADLNSNIDPSASDSVEGNAWIIVPIENTYYAGIYDYLIAGEPCHTLDTGSIANLYDSDKSLGKRVDKDPLKNWIALGGDIIYFMVSGLAKDGKSNVEERSQLIKVELPSKDGINPTVVHPPCSEDPTGPHCSVGQCNIPNRSGIVREIARDNSDQFEEGQALNSDREDGDISLSEIPDDERWEFMDTLLTRLHETDNNWGYKCDDEDCEDISTDAVAYLCNNNDDANTVPIDIMDAEGDLQWGVEEAIDDRWKFPRLGQTTTTTTQGEGEGEGEDEGEGEGEGSAITDTGTAPCTSEQIEDGFLTVDNECIPLCARLGFYGQDDKVLENISEEFYDLYGELLKHVEVNEGDACEENEEYNILPITIKTAFVTSVTSGTSGTPSNSCCRRSKKTDCSGVAPHYSSKTGEEGCYPSCGQAAVLAGYDADNHVQSDLNTACNASTIGGRYRVRTWELIPNFYDPYNFKVLDSTKVVTDTGHSCCVKGSPSHEPALEHNGDGTYNVIAGTPVSTTTTTTGVGGVSTTTTTTITNASTCDEQACGQSCVNQGGATGFCSGSGCECIGGP